MSLYAPDHHLPGWQITSGQHPTPHPIFPHRTCFFWSMKNKQNFRTVYIWTSWKGQLGFVFVIFLLKDVFLHDSPSLLTSCQNYYKMKLGDNKPVEDFMEYWQAYYSIRAPWPVAFPWAPSGVASKVTNCAKWTISSSRLACYMKHLGESRGYGWCLRRLLTCSPDGKRHYVTGYNDTAYGNRYFETCSVIIIIYFGLCKDFKFSGKIFYSQEGAQGPSHLLSCDPNDNPSCPTGYLDVSWDNLCWGDMILKTFSSPVF